MITNIYRFNASNNEIFAFRAVLVFKSLSHNVLLITRKDNRNLLKSRLLFRKIAYFTECEIFRICLKHESNNLSVTFQFA